MKLIRRFLAVLTILVAVNASAYAEEYAMLIPPQPTHTGKKIEVLEFFFYGCIHCFHLHPELSKWEQTMPGDVSLDFVPVHFNPSWEPMAYTYYALKAMGQQKRLDDKLYNALNQDGLPLYNMDNIADFVAKNGVNRAKFVKYYQSFSVQSEVERSGQMTTAYQIEGTPTIVVDGKYVITGLEPADTIRVLDQVINKVRQERGK
jgi:protein dithiol oxidoreductase (disulfide-forming)